ncbi:coiled-coil domain-containing protein 86 [Paralichthys olivaceus]|uniref:coiled-coil domain-containing protein 86 n=1 Tax=Paralichthys olivaceus TaxID=8255 RepID=UPI00097DAE73|nr:PREDICTED: coiled-coil domain-containing protein 86 [Paralichthys olivaceus]
MSRRQRPVPEAAHMEEEEEVQEPPPETRRTRSGRRVRTPAALLDSEEPLRTPSRRTRRTVLQELPAVEETNTGEPEHKPETVPEEMSDVSAEPEPCTGAEPAGEVAHVPRPAAAAETVPASPETVPKKKARLAPSGKQNPVIPLGKPKSGRVWKDRSKQRFSALVRDKPLCSSWEKKMQAKREKDLVKQFTLQLKEDKAKQKEEKRKRREDNLKRRTENERKAEIVQVIRNTAKIKRMKKKQLRKIEKRDTLALLQKTQKQNVKAKGQKNTDKDLT